MEKSISGYSVPPAASGKKPTQPPPTGLNQRNQFVRLAVTMTWQLALAVLLPIIGGVQLDKVLHSSPLCAILGFLTAGLLAVVVMYSIAKTAAALPVPHLTAQQRKSVQRSYDEEDDD